MCMAASYLSSEICDRVKIPLPEKELARGVHNRIRDQLPSINSVCSNITTTCSYTPLPHNKAASPITAAPASPIPVFIGAAAPLADALADALLAIELADDVAELATLLAELVAELRAELPLLLADDSTLERELLTEERRDEAEDVTLETSLEILELMEAATELREEESALEEEEEEEEVELSKVAEVTRRVAEEATPAVAWPTCAAVRLKRVERVMRRKAVSCISRVGGWVFGSWM
jgi:hypothetical protein